VIHETREGEDGRVLVVTVDRPAAKNALDAATVDKLRRLFEGLARNAEGSPRKRAIRAVVLTGAGGTFVSGGDLRELQAVRDRATTEDFCDRGRAMCDAIEDAFVPVVCAIEGFALGGGAELACACDVRVAASDAKIGFLQVRMGVTTAWGTYSRLVAQVGAGTAADVVLGGRLIGADEARALRLVEHVAPMGTARAQAVALADDIARGAPLAIGYVKELSRMARRNADLRALERERFVESWLSEDHAEAVQAFFDKRPPRFEA